ncbi:MAG: hypothetical protein COA43_12935 [Robiginitomaculum sp.]|nr:MAG: hypothetical protein COA43_12935 [Robiginitomaculum sp.]
MIDIYENTAAKRNKSPRLSVLIPYFRDDPAKLLSALGTHVDIEILIYDDGTQDPVINKALTSLASKISTPVRLLFAHENKGRSTARNILTENAKAEWVLFLDADMLPLGENFVADYLREIEKNDSDIIFGGFSVVAEKQSNDTELHRYFSLISDCLSAEERTKFGPQYICSSNLCVRTSVLAACGFDTSFEGWGWEDSEWAARVAKSYTIKHAEIPALHLGLESTETLLSRFKTSGANYVKFTSAHPELAKTLTLYKMVHKFKKIPGQKLLRPLYAVLVRMNFAPAKLRLLALKLWRASWYAEAFS